MRNSEAGDRSRDDAIGRVARSNREWILEALPHIRSICSRKETFDTDDIWEELEKKGVFSPEEPRAIGAVLVRARKQGWCENALEMRRSERPECHRRPITVWKSLIYK